MGSGQADISVIEARNLPPKTKAGVCNVYVRFRVGEGFFSWSNSNRVPKISNPKWDFLTTLRVKEKSQARVLHAKVMEAKFLSKDESIGECFVDLDTLPHNEAHDMWIPLANSLVELHLCVTYYPLGRVYVHRTTPALPSQKAFLEAVSPDTIASPPSPRPKMLAPSLLQDGSAIPVSSTPITREQARAEELYLQAIQVLKEGLLTKSSDQLRNASDILAESLKVYRLGKAYAMLAYIFYLFDCPELLSKYLGFAEKLDSTFPVVAQLRKALVEEACSRKELDTPSDRLSVVVVGATGISVLQNAHVGQEMFCKLRVGFFEEEKESNLLPLTPDNECSIMWREFFEVTLTKASERYKFANQFFRIQLYVKSGESVEMLAETRPLDLFTFVRDTVVDRWVHLVPQEGNQLAHPIGIVSARTQPMIRVIFNYQMGLVTEDEAAELLYSAIYCRDRPMTESLIRRKSINLNACFKEFPYSTSKDLEPQYSTPLTKAARFGHRRMIKELISLGTDINGQDKDGFTPLMRALQYDRLYNNTRAIKLLLSLGADTEIENSKGINCYGYSKSNDIWLYLKSLKPTPLYRFVVVICSSCKYVQIPHCTERGEACLQSDACKCDVPTHCSYCSLPLEASDVMRWLSSKNEIGSVHNAFLSRLPNNLNCCLVQCKCCTSFGFAATESAQGLQLCKVEGDDIICTKHASDETMVYPLKTSGPLWMIAHHWKGCYLPSSSKISPVVLSRQQTASISTMLAFTPTWVHDPSPPPFQLEQLPSELFQLVLSHLSCEDLAAVECVSRNLRDTSRDEVFWKSKFAQDFFMSENSVAKQSALVSSPSLVLLSSLSSPDFSWKDLYVDYNLLYCWIRDLLLDETFNFKYDVWICTTNGHVFVDLKLVGKKYIFNLDGEPFSFDNDFSITLEFTSMGCMVSANIIATGQPPEKVIALNASGQLSLPKTCAISLEALRAHTGKVSLRMPLQETALSRWVNPYLSIMVPGYQSFMQLKDNVGGSVILDLFYYTIDSITLDDKIPR